MQDSSSSHNLYLTVSKVSSSVKQWESVISGFWLPVVISDTLEKNHQQCWESWPDPGCQPSVPVGGAILSAGMPGISGFRLPVVISDKLWESHQQYWESHPVLGCQLSVPGGRAILSIGLPGSSSVSIKPSSDVYVLLLFLRKLHSRPSCALSRGHSGFSQQQKASVLPVWSSSSGETLVETSAWLLGAFALAPLALTRLWACSLGKRQCCNHRALS